MGQGLVFGGVLLLWNLGCVKCRFRPCGREPCSDYISLGRPLGLHTQLQLRASGRARKYRD